MLIVGIVGPTMGMMNETPYFETESRIQVWELQNSGQVSTMIWNMGLDEMHKTFEEAMRDELHNVDETKLLVMVWPAAEWKRWKDFVTQMPDTDERVEWSEKELAHELNVKSIDDHTKRRLDNGRLSKAEWDHILRQTRHLLVGKRMEMVMNLTHVVFMLVLLSLADEGKQSGSNVDNTGAEISRKLRAWILFIMDLTGDKRVRFQHDLKTGAGEGLFLETGLLGNTGTNDPRSQSILRMAMTKLLKVREKVIMKETRIEGLEEVVVVGVSLSKMFALGKELFRELKEQNYVASFR